MPIEPYYEPDRLIENIREPYPLEYQRRTPLSEARPDIAIEWHPNKNDGWGPEDFSYGSQIKAWWRCAKNKKHVWQAAIANRTSAQGAGCPDCYFESYGIDLRQFPAVLKFFNHKKNGDIDPHKIPAGAAIHWRCKEGIKHKWCSRFNIQVVDAFCPFCRGRKAAPDNNLTNFPKLAKEFHPTRNGALKAKKIVPGSKVKVWWKCPEGADHEFEMRPYERTVKGYNCPCCSRLKFSKTNSLAAEFPAIARQWYKTKNGNLKPSGISSRSKEVVWWKCPKGDDHEWKASVMRRTYEGTGCPFCANRALSTENNLATAFPNIAKEFDLKKNDPIKPHQVVATSATEYWWFCKNKHSWLRAVYLRTKRGSRCPDCPDYRSRKITNPLSNFPEIAKYLHPTKNGNLKPSEISSGSKEVVWWNCKKGPDHAWQAWIDITVRKGFKCPFCEGFRLSVTNNLKALHPGLAKEWHKTRNEQKPTETLPGSAHKAWWRCSNCRHEWQRECYLRTRRRSACPECKSYPA